MTSEELSRCLACDGFHLLLCLDLGQQPLANAFKASPDEPQQEYRLAVNLCERCFHLQLTHAIHPDLMFKHYLYVSGVSGVYREYLDWFARFSVNEYGSPEGRGASSALDIGCNDGTQLDSYKSRGLSTFGVDPARNIHAVSTGKGHNVFCGYFDEFTSGRTFDIINAAHVFAHNRTPHSFLLKCKALMHEHSLLFIQTSQANMVQNGEFDTIYHEHLCFFSASSMRALAARAELPLVDILTSDVHGTSYIFVLSKSRVPAARVAETLTKEAAAGLTKSETYAKWSARCANTAAILSRTVSNHTGRIVGYGAAAKGNTLLNFAKIRVDVIVDDNPLKQNKFTPGMCIPVVSADYIGEIPVDEPVWFIPLAWNFYDEIRAKILQIRGKRAGDRFVRYFPEVIVCD